MTSQTQTALCAAWRAKEYLLVEQAAPVQPSAVKRPIASMSALVWIHIREGWSISILNTTNKLKPVQTSVGSVQLKLRQHAIKLFNCKSAWILGRLCFQFRFPVSQPAEPHSLSLLVPCAEQLCRWLFAQPRNSPAATRNKSAAICVHHELCFWYFQKLLPYGSKPPWWTPKQPLLMDARSPSPRSIANPCLLSQRLFTTHCRPSCCFASLSHCLKWGSTEAPDTFVVTSFVLS